MTNSQGSRTSFERVMKERMPHPIASAWQRCRIVSNEQDRLQKLFSCSEVILRTISAFLIPDYFRGDRVHDVDQEILGLGKPSLGHWVRLIRQLSTALAKRQSPPPFVPEAIQWVFGDNGRVSRAFLELDYIISLRNRITHDTPAVSHNQLKSWGDTLQNWLEKALSDLEWLSSYSPVRVLKAMPTAKNTFWGQLQFFSGITEFTEPITLEWGAFLLLQAMYLVNANRNAFLRIDPFISILPDPVNGMEHCFLLKAITHQGKQILRTDETSGFKIESGVLHEDQQIDFLTWARTVAPQTLVLVNPIQQSDLATEAIQTSRSSGEVLAGRFHLQEELGSGGMAQVYRATDLIAGKDVAIKILRMDVTKDPICRERFLREAKTLSTIRHDHIVTILEIGTLEEKIPFFTMPVFKNGNLNDLKCRQEMTLERIAELASQVLEALSCLHAWGIIHRDLKPDNLLLDDNGTLKLADFGIALKVGEADRLTHVLERVGTLAYMAPEQLRNEEISPAVDIYSLGLILHELLTGAEIAARQKHPRSDEFARILHQMGSIDPRDRPSAANLLQVFKDFQVGKSIPSEEPADRPKTLEMDLTVFKRMEQIIEEISENLGDGSARYDLLIELLSEFCQSGRSLIGRLRESADREDLTIPENTLLCALPLIGRRALTVLGELSLPVAQNPALCVIRTQIQIEIVGVAETLLKKTGHLPVAEAALKADVGEDFFEGFFEFETEPPVSKDWFDLVDTEDELFRHEAIMELLGPDQEQILRRISLLDAERKEKIHEFLWTKADVLLIEGRGRSKGVIVASINQSNPTCRLGWSVILKAYTVKNGKYPEIETVQEILNRLEVSIQKVILKSLLVHPAPQFRQLAISSLQPEDFWFAISHQNTTVACLLEYWRRLKESVEPS